MNTFTKTLAILLTFSLVAPAAFFFAPPQKAEAAGVGCIGGILGSLGITKVASIVAVPIQNLTIESSTGITAGGTYASCFNDLILMPLARAAIKAIIHKMTASVVNAINGGNGSGQPSYVQNVSAHLQIVGDSAASPFITRITARLNSAFGSSISASLQKVYAQQTSMAGFYAANQNTLPQYSSNPNAFLAGDWSKGGAGAFLALATQPQNNPYMLYQAAAGQLGSNVGQAQTNRRQDLAYSGGFLSFCGDGGSKVSSGGVMPKAVCMNDDGSQSPVQTPGSVIHDYAAKAIVDAGFDEQYAQLISANDIDGALSTIASAMINQVLGSANGLFGAGRSSGSGPSVVDRLNTYSDSSLSASQTASQTAQSIQSRVSGYKSNWETISASAQNASNYLTALSDFCTAAAKDATDSTFAAKATAQATAAQTILSSVVAPVLASAQAQIDIAASAQAAADKVLAETSAGSNGNSNTFASDLANLTNMPPSTSDITSAQANVGSTGTAQASPAGSLSISGGTTVDQMNLLSTNAVALKTSACTPTALTQFSI